MTLLSNTFMYHGAQLGEKEAQRLQILSVESKKNTGPITASLLVGIISYINYKRHQFPNKHRFKIPISIVWTKFGLSLKIPFLIPNKLKLIIYSQI